MSTLGTVSCGIRAPIIRQGDDLVQIVTDSVMRSVRENNLTLNDKDVVAVTEAVLARAQGNYASLKQIASDVRAKTGGGALGLVFPILSRNRFSHLLKAVAMGCERLTVQLSYPSDEVGNGLVSIDQLDELGINPAVQSFTEEQFRKICPDPIHPFTGVDYIKYYRELGDNISIVLSNDPAFILRFSDTVISADIHSRFRTLRALKNAGAKRTFAMTDFMTAPVEGSGYHSEYGLLGSNLATDNSVKLFPRDAMQFCDALQKSLSKASGKQLECMVYGDGAFKDPVGGIWELADPVVSPGYTKGLEGTPNELKLKYLADNRFGSLSGKDAEDALKKAISEKSQQSGFVNQGTTPRRITDLLGSLADLTSGSGDKGTPIILIQNYFKNYSE